jgi:hypothetical protein
MASRIELTELDFDQIKENLKNYLKQQTEFTDYDFDGAGLSILLDILAYNTHYNAYYLNMAANEAFLDTAILRDSVASHAKTLGYVPASTAAAIATIKIVIETNSYDAGSLTLPKGFALRSELIDGTSYSFVTIQDYTISKTGTQFIFDSVDIYQGKYVNYVFTYDEATNPKKIFTIPQKNIDTQTLTVTVKDSPANTDFKTYVYVDDVVELDANSQVYFLQETRNLEYQLYFGDGNVGKEIIDGSEITATYVVTDGPISNGANSFTGLVGIGAYTSYVVSSISESAGGAYRESTDSIKFSAPLQYTSQNRLVTLKDYEFYIQNKYTAVDSISVWGGEDNIPKVYGKVFVSLKPKDNYYISETEKQRIIDEIINPKSIVSVKTEIVDPEYLYILLDGKIIYDPTKTTYTSNQLSNLARLTMIAYNQTYLNKFDSIFVLSKLEEQIGYVDSSVIGNEFKVKLQKRFEPTLGVNRTYTLNFNASLARGTATDSIKSTEFYVVDSSNVTRSVFIREVPYSYTGIQNINITNPGYGYTSIPTVTITGDGSGATATAEITNGRISKITVTNRGSNYTRAIVTISGGSGNLGSASAVLDARFGTLEMIYFDDLARKQVVDSEVGTIDYDSGTVILDNLKVDSLLAGKTDIRFTVESGSEIVKSVRNQIVTIDTTDPTSFTIEMEKL